MNRKVDLSISCYGEVKDGRYDIVALPWGATEPHNLHLPYMTDCILSHDVAVSAALIAKQKYGVNCSFVISCIIFLVAFVGTKKYKLNPIGMIIACGLAGLLLY